ANVASGWRQNRMSISLCVPAKPPQPPGRLRTCELISGRHGDTIEQVDLGRRGKYLLLPLSGEHIVAVDDGVTARFSDPTSTLHVHAEVVLRLASDPSIPVRAKGTGRRMCNSRVEHRNISIHQLSVRWRAGRLRVHRYRHIVCDAGAPVYADP